MTFLELLQEHGTPYWSEGRDTRPGWIQLKCPQCQRDRYLGYNVANGYMNCWSCGGLRLWETVASLLNVPLPQARQLLLKLDRTPSPFPLPVRKGKLILPEGVGPLLPAHRKYLTSRGFDPDELVTLWGLGGIGISPRLGWRVFIPITLNKEVVSWTTRSINPKATTRYISASPEMEAINHKTILYGEDHANHSTVVVEGPADVWKIGPGAVALFGTAYSKSQLLRISRHPVRAICFDNESPAQRRASHLCEELSVFPGETYNISLDSKDPGSATKKEIKQLRKSFLE